MIPLIDAKFSAGYGSRTILHDVHIDVMPGEILGVVGSSGSGKSTLVLALMGLLGYLGGFIRGELDFAGQDLLRLKPRELRHLLGCRLALVPPSPHSALNPKLTIMRHFQEAWRAHSRNDWTTGLARAKERLDSVDLPSDMQFLARFPGQISTGQAQRVLIALALLHGPQLLIADEPTSALDTVTQAGLLSLLRRINKQEGTAIVFVSHDLLAVADLCSRMAVLSEGRVIETVATAHLAQEAQHPTTVSLLRALPRPIQGLRDISTGF
jgi:ABC-type glutathione transport system ATPase component